MSAEKMITVRMPQSHWRQIVDDIKNMCGTGEHKDIEILSKYIVVEEEE